MAGIGFSLRSMSRTGTLSACLGSIGHAAMVAAGPWLFTVISLGALEFFTRREFGSEEWSRCSTIIVYNFSFSLVLSGPIVMVLTRHLADRLYEQDFEKVHGMLLGSLAVLWTVQTLFGVPFAMLVMDVPPIDRLLFLAGFFTTGGIWVACVFLSTLRGFNSISAAFILGMLVAFGAGVGLAQLFGGSGALAGFTLGLAVVLFVLMGRIVSEFPFPVIDPFAFLGAFRKYWEMAAVGLLYNAAVWVDKWVMWFAPGRKVIAPGLVSNPAYDTAMFLAYLTSVPALALFLISVETRFYERYVTFYDDIQNHGTLREINRNHANIMSTLTDGFRNISVIQGVACYLALLVAPGLIGLAKGGVELVPIFRFGVLGVFFHTLLLFVIVIASYFDLRRIMLWVTLLFFTSNALLTWAIIPWGPAFTGYGYFMASVVSFLAAYAAVAWSVKRLPYMTFIGNNPTLH